MDSILKVDEEQRLVFGWAYISETEGGELVIDKQGDFIDEPVELEKAAYDFTLNARVAGDMHEKTEGIGRLVESIAFTPEKLEKMGLDDASIPIGWWLGFYIDDDDTWADVKSGKYTGFSVGGSGNRQKV